jgi:NADPH-dependent glutamate synthase beta subunit-like oxidoreductase
VGEQEAIQPGHLVVVVGGAVAGAEAVAQFVSRGIRCVVLEQNPRPYGKIEDGLPRWHGKLRAQEYAKIDGKLAHPLVQFVPRTRLGQEIALTDLLALKPSAIVLANGAWRDRPLALDGIDAYVGRGFYYQNPFVYWFNHYDDPDYRGPAVEFADGGIVVGGGLASLDVVKIMMLEAVTRALKARGMPADPVTLEHGGLKRALEQRGLSLEALGVKGCTLFYRRTVEDMPVADPPENATPQQLERNRQTRRKLLQNFQERYLFRFQERSLPVGLLAEGDRLAGLTFARTEIKGRAVTTVPGSEAPVRAPLTVSSIGSIPEPVAELPMAGELYRLKDLRTGEVEGLPGVFALGNAVTGKGNILDSLKHGKLVAQHILENYLTGTASGYEEILEDAAVEAREKARAVADRVRVAPLLSAERITTILQAVRSLQAAVGYPGDYRAYIATVPPTC